MIGRLREDITGTASDDPEEKNAIANDSGYHKANNWDDMVAFFKQRTAAHIARVIAAMDKITTMTKTLNRAAAMARAKRHDESKYGSVELIPYIWLTDWYRTNKKTIYPAGMQAQIEEATRHHVKTNPHHVDFHNKPSDMSPLDIAEMVSDWVSMAIEKNNSLRDWAEKFMSDKAFTEDQKIFIDKLVRLFE